MKICSCELLVLLVVICLTGCGKSDIERTSIKGNVSIGGKPVATGNISFIPQSGTESPTAGAEISNGQYTIGKEKGPTPGTYTIQIMASESTGKKTTVTGLPGGPREIEETVSIVPVKYQPKGPSAPKGAGTEILTASVKQGENVIDFSLDDK